MRQGGFAGGFFAIYIPDSAEYDLDAMERAMNNPPYTFPLPPPIPVSDAQPVALSEAAHLMWMQRQGGLRIVRSVADIRACMAAGDIAAVMHMEGAEPIDEGLDTLYLWHAAGLRSLGPVWSRPTVFGNGVPFAFPATPDTGDGLTDAGKRLVRACNELRIMLDLSHLNEKGFNDVAALSGAPLVATHSNAHSVTPSSRNLTDRQLRMIAESGGMVGLNYATCFLRPDGRAEPFSGWDPLLRHMDHLISILGEDHVGLGSDFDGATMPGDLGDVLGQQRLLQAFRAHGYGESLLRRIAHENWLGLLERTWGA
jgi:membrane dipeptidase